MRLNCFITEGVCKSEPFRLLFLNTLGLKIEEIKIEHLDCETESLPCPKPEATNNDSNQTFTAAEFKAGSWKMTGMEWRHLVGNFAGQEKGEERGNNKIPSDPRGLVRRSSVPKWWSNTGVRKHKLAGTCGLEFLELHSGEGNLRAEHRGIWISRLGNFPGRHRHHRIQHMKICIWHWFLGICSPQFVPTFLSQGWAAANG